MRCPKCNCENPDSAKFCNNCGEKLVMIKELVCPNCGFRNPLDSKFCTECGCRIQDIDSIRNEVKKLISNNPDGYNSLVESHELPRFVYNSTLENCNLILSMSNNIIQRQKEMNDKQLKLESERIEKQRREKERQERELEEKKLLIFDTSTTQINKQQEKIKGAVTNMLYISRNSLSFGPSDTRQTIRIKYSSEWNVQTIDNWVHVLDQNGYEKPKITGKDQDVVITVDKNHGDKRTSYLHIWYDHGDMKHIKIEQETSKGIINKEYSGSDIYSIIGNILAWIIGIGSVIFFIMTN